MLAAIHPRVFTEQEVEQGWPATMTPWQLANMQRPCGSLKSDPVGWRRCASLLAALSDACGAGQIECIATTRKVMVQPEQDMHPSGFGPWPAAYTVDGVPLAYTRPAVFRDEVLHHIAPCPFLAWLKAQGEEPCSHTLAWCKSQGVTVGESAPAADVAHPRPVESPEPAPSAFDPRIVQPAGSTWEVCRKRPGDPKRSWSEAEKAAMRAMRASMSDTEIGEVAGVSREAIRRAIDSRKPRGASRAMGGIVVALVKR